MAKYCTYCGRKLEEGEVCHCCPEAEAAAAAEEAKKASLNAEGQPEEPEKPKSKAVSEDGQTVDLGIAITETAGKVGGFFKKNMKKLIICGSALIVVIAAIIVVCCITAGNYKTPIKRLVSAINKGDDATYLELSNAAYLKSLRNLTEEASSIGESVYKVYDEALEEKFDDLSDEYDDWKIEFEFTDAEKLSKSELDDFKDELEDIQDKADDYETEIDEMDLEDEAEDMADSMGCSESEALSFMKKTIKYFSSFEKMEITAGYEVKGRYILYNGKDKISSTDRGSFWVLKVSGEWVVWDSDSFSFDYEDENYSLYSFLNDFLDPEFSSDWYQ